MKSTSRRPRAPVLCALSMGTYIFLYLPLLVLVTFSFNESRLTAVWRGFTWKWYASLLGNELILGALQRSILIALAATLAATAIGTAGALALSRYRFRGESVSRGLFYLPIVVPEIVMASSLLIFFSAVECRRFDRVLRRFSKNVLRAAASSWTAGWISSFPGRPSTRSTSRRRSSRSRSFSRNGARSFPSPRWSPSWTRADARSPTGARGLFGTPSRTSLSFDELGLKESNRFAS